MPKIMNKLPLVPLGNKGTMVSSQGLGCMGFSEFYGPNSLEETEAVFDTALESGITLFDTADMYGLGENERLLGRLLRKAAGKVQIATKFGYTRTENNPNDWSISNRPEYIRKAAENSLKRLGTEAIDLYYMHRRDPTVPLAESVGTMANLVKEGKVKAIGLSAVTAEELREAHAIHPVAALQSEWSLFSREVEDGVITMAASLGITFVPYAPLGRGLLTQGFNSQTMVLEDARRNFPRFSDQNLAANTKIVNNIRDIASLKNFTVSQLALAWLYTRAEILGVNIVPIPGTRHKARLLDNVAAATFRLSAAEMLSLETLAAQVQGVAV